MTSPSSSRREDDVMAEVADRGRQLSTTCPPETKNSWGVCLQNFLELPQQEETRICTQTASPEALAF